MKDPKEEFEKLKLEEIKGEVIGLALENHFNFILEKEGREGLKKLEEGLEKLGCPLKYEEIKNFQWYPRKIDEAMYLVIRRVFGWKDEVWRESGKWGAKISYITRIMMRYFVSIERVFRETSNYWRKYYPVGNLEPVEINKEERYLILELKNFNTVCPEHCRYWEGYFWQIGSYVLPKENLKVEEINCIFRGGDLHRFKVSW